MQTTPDIDLTPALTRRFWRAMSERYGTRVVPKKRSPLMHLVGAGLGLIRVMSYRRFMERYTTVVAGRIYPWFAIGEGDQEALWYQIVVCVHEHQHVIQARRDGLSGFHLPYLLSARRRALIEAEAYRCNMEMNWWKNGRFREPSDLAGRLAEYGCGQEAVDAARRYLQRAADRVRRGDIANEASRFAIDWLEKRLDR